MATKEGMTRALESNGGQMVAGERLENLLGRVDVKKRFDEILGQKAAAFISSIISAVKANPQLQACDPMSVISSAVVAATLDLPINSNLGFAAIVPYRKEGRPVAQFQMMWRGFVQLGQRTGLYKTISVSEVYEDEIEYWHPITGEMKMRPIGEWKQRYEGNGKIVGYAAYFRLLNGFEKFLYMTVDQLKMHGKKYSKSFQKGFGPWVDDPHVMYLKTPLKMLISKFGPLSVDVLMQRAIRADQAVIDADGEVKEYPDAVDAETVGAPALEKPAAADPDESPIG